MPYPVGFEYERFDTSANEYTVLCGYEFDPNELFFAANASKDYPNTYYPQVIADRIEFNSAAHLLRTLGEHGEADMVYFVVPSTMWAFASNSALRQVKEFVQAARTADQGRQAREE